ncbi:TonB-dependent receptor [Halarcobacter sp.]|uniref:TonB-dependent receptor n=1 Tax=Halarcobacter sp. TaxID=2321133 RepID=UPI003B00D372
MKKIKTLLLCSAISLSATSNVTLNDLTITATKTEENILKVPASITVINNEDIENKNIETLEDIGAYVPSLMFFNSGQGGLSAPSMRGVTANIVSFSTPVSLYVDGVPTMSSFGFTDGLLDIERIEVLKGPQGTLYGKNSEVGVINVITKKPDNETKGKIFTTIGTDGKREFGAKVSGAIIKDKFYGSLTYKHTEKDGFIKNTFTGANENDKESDYGKLNFRYTPTDNLDISFIASRMEMNNGSSDWAKAGLNLDNVQVSSNMVGYVKPTTNSFALSIDYDINEDAKFTSITSKRIHKDKTAVDSDLTSNTIVHMYRDYEFDTLSQEFRLENNFADTKVVSGIYLDKQDDEVFFKRITMMDPTGSNSVPQDLSSKSYSVFTNVTTPITQKLSINAGLRYDYEKKDIQVALRNIDLEESFNNFSPKLSLIYDINKDSSTYFTVAKGYRSGGFNPFAPSNDNKVYDEESLTSYELGYKGLFLNDSLLFSSAIYYMNIDDMQVQEMPMPAVVYMVNAANAKSKGIELELQAFLSEDLTLFASTGINSTKFDDYKDINGNYSDNYSTFAPKYNFNIGLQYKNLDGYFARVDVNGYGKTYYDVENKYYQKAYELVNTKIGYETKNFEIYFYGKNIFDKEHHATNAFVNGTNTAYVDDREFGIHLAYKF